MWPFKKEIVYTEQELQKCLSILKKDIFEEILARVKEQKPKDAIETIKRLAEKYGY
jgi:hypothetical protein